jgi:Ran GTPase-activating protein (RanGAP) involved in mRNA processing and transport
MMKTRPFFLRKNTTSYQQKQLRKTIKNLAKNDCKTKEIVINDHDFTEESIAQLSISFVGNTQARVVYLQNCNITARGAYLLAYALKKNSSIEHMWLNGNNIDDSGVKAIAYALRDNCTLKTLGLGDNNISNSGGKHICKALKYNTFVTDVYLEGNQISDKILNKINDRCNRETLDVIWENSSTSTLGSSEEDLSVSNNFTLTSSFVKKMLSSIQEEDEDAFDERGTERRSFVAMCA